MSFNSYEYSIEDGQPVYLYRFSLNDKIWRFTSTDEDISAGGFDWKAVPMGDDGVKQTGDATTDALTITTSTAIVPAQIYMAYPPARPMQLAIFIKHASDPEIRAIYVGEVTQFSVVQPGTCRFTCETFTATMSREGLRLGWQRNCTYALYDPLTCKLPKEPFAVAGPVAAVVNNLVTIPALNGQPDNRFRGGFVEWTDPTRGIERRGIEAQIGSAVLMFGGGDGIAPGTVLTAYPGCARTVEACLGYGNFSNYGGFPMMKGRSPFDGNPVFN